MYFNNAIFNAANRVHIIDQDFSIDYLFSIHRKGNYLNKSQNLPYPYSTMYQKRIINMEIWIYNEIFCRSQARINCRGEMATIKIFHFPKCQPRQSGYHSNQMQITTINHHWYHVGISTACSEETQDKPSWQNKSLIQPCNQIKHENC